MFGNKKSSALQKEAVAQLQRELDGSIIMASLKHNAPFDLSWLKMKITVKIAKPLLKSGGSKIRWYFTLGKNDLKNADVFVFFCLDRKKKIDSTFMVPTEFVSRTSVTITANENNGRYQYFRTRGDMATWLLKVMSAVPHLKTLTGRK